MKRILLAILLVAVLVSCTPEEEPNPIVCDDGFELIEDTCVIIEDDPLECDDGFELMDDECIEIEVDPDPEVCEDGYERIDEECVEIEVDYTKTPNPDGYFEFVHDELVREYVLHLPEDLPSQAPLVVVMHGFTSNSFNIQARSEFDALADEHSFAVVYPQGYDEPISHWNANLTLSTVNDVGYLVSLVEYLQTEYDLSSTNVFATGFSNGGFMSYALACDANDTFKAIASVAGLMSGITWDTCDPAEPMNVLQIHGTGDIVVPPDGTMESFGGWGGAPAVEEMLMFWRNLGEANTEEVLIVSEITTAYHYTSETTETQVWLYTIEDYPHAWPGPNDGVLFMDEGFVASELIWTFFEQFIQ